VRVGGVHGRFTRGRRNKIFARKTFRGDLRIHKNDALEPDLASLPRTSLVADAAVDQPHGVCRSAGFGGIAVGPKKMMRAILVLDGIGRWT